MCRLSIDLLRDWDEDGNGLVDRDEFFKALPVLGIFVSKADADELFGLLIPFFIELVFDFLK